MKKNMAFMKKSLLLLVFCIFAGCETIPPGTAPEGPITKFSSISDKKPVSEKTAIVAMATDLITTSYISGAKTPPSVMFIPTSFDKNSMLQSNYTYKFNNLTLKVYEVLFRSNLITAPPSLTDFDYSIMNIAYENPIFHNVEKGYKVFSWQLALFDKKTNSQVWGYSLNVLTPVIKPNKIDKAVTDEIKKIEELKK